MALAVIGAALPRTGTVSLKVALEMLGFGRCYHMSELILRPEDAALWLAASQGHPQWDRLLGDFGATADFPACHYWRELAEHYPAAKVILTTREPEGWVDSVLSTVGDPAHAAALLNSPLGPMMVAHGMTGGQEQDRARMIESFHAYQQAVRAAIPPERLLVFSAGDGWAPLCAFLGRPVPDMPYPRLNSRAEIGTIIADDAGQTASFADIQKRIRAAFERGGEGHAAAQAAPEMK